MKLSDKERQVLEALWAAPEGLTLGQAVEALRAATGWSRNTVLTYLTRMEAKGLVAIVKDAAPHRYRAAVAREDWAAEARRGLLEEKAAVLGRCVNRVSMGVQSFNPKFRSLIGRRGGGAGTVERALDLLRSNGIANIGFDLIYALPEQTLDDWVRELETSLGYMPRHISAYSLIIEDGTELAARDFPPEDNELSFRMWQTAQDFLGAHGMPRYEISNYAAEKYECRHNQNVWHGETYLGLGPGACSFDGAVRRTEVPSLARWLKGDAAEQDIIEERKRLSEIFIMGLRTVRGWKKSEFSQFSVLSWREMWSKIIEKQISDGMLKESPDCISPTEKGLAFWNDLAEAYF